MKIIGIDGLSYNWNLTNHVPKCDDEKKRSKCHLRARNLLTREFAYDKILEEVPLPGAGKRMLFADFYIPRRKLMIEVHGIQHYEFVSFYYANKLEFYKAKGRDRKKRQWAKLNNITFVEFPYEENDDQWKHRLSNR